jgi:crotonobetainyl-CoA:carnitine CoA-transferase CaiB-like acyl-CoA transferase
MFMASLPLKGIRVLEMCHAWAGPHAGELLSDLGAEVIKVEGPEGDMMRGGANATIFSGVFVDCDLGNESWNRNAIFIQLNRGKMSVALDLNLPEGKELLFKLLGAVDIFICNLAVGSVNKLGLSYDAIKKVKQDIIYVTINAFGLTSPWAKYKVYGVVLEPLSGFFSLTGYTDDARPMRSGVDHIDPISGTHAVGAALAALLYRKRTGLGQHINLSFMESAVNFIGPEILDYTMNARIPGPSGNRCDDFAPQGCYKCKGEDQWISVAVKNDDDWRLFCSVIGNPDLAVDQRFVNGLARLENHDDLDRIITGWTEKKDKFDIMRILQSAGIAAGPVLDNKEVLENEHLRARGFFQETHDPAVGNYTLIGARQKMSGARNVISGISPKYGEHNDYVFGELLGIDAGKLAEYKTKGAILSKPV